MVSYIPFGNIQIEVQITTPKITLHPVLYAAAEKPHTPKPNRNNISAVAQSI